VSLEEILTEVFWRGKIPVQPGQCQALSAKWRQSLAFRFGEGKRRGRQRRAYLKQAIKVHRSFPECGRRVDFASGSGRASAGQAGLPAGREPYRIRYEEMRRLLAKVLGCNWRVNRYSALIERDWSVYH
jgi:hypothetical protein